MKIIRRALLLLTATAIMAAVSSCTAARVTEPDTYPADWTANPTAGVVYEPIPESGVSHD